MRGLFLLSAILISGILSAQFLPFYDQTHFHEFIKNPAATGAEYYSVIQLSSRKQWWGVKNAPNTHILSANARLGKFNFYNPKMMLNKNRFRAVERSGLGVAVYYDQNGPMQISGAFASYGYHIPFQISTLSFGLAGSVAEYKIDYSLLNPDDPDDEILARSDPGVWVLNANAGVYFSSEYYFVGLSVTELFPSNTLDDEFYHQPRPNVYFSGGYRFAIVPGLLYEPAFELRKPAKRDYVFDLNSKFYFGNAHWAGVNFRSDGTAGLYLGINLRRYLYLAYLYEYSLGDIQESYNNTHTIMLGQNIGLRSFTAIRKMRFR